MIIVSPSIRPDPDVLDGPPLLHCPACDWPYIHIEQVHVSARHEDGPFIEVSVDTSTGEVTYPGIPGPAGTTVGEGRRHRTALRIACENCHTDSALVFTQHKGNTFVESVPLTSGADQT